MARSLATLALVVALACPAMAARRRPTCVAVMIEMIPVDVCARPARRR